MKKKILIIGNGAKEYALAKKLSEKHEIYITPASDALKEFTTCIDIREDNPAELLDYVLENGIDMTIPISDKSIKSDIVSVFQTNKQPIFAPNAKSGKICFDKSYAKKTLYKLRIPTPKFGIFEKENMVLDYIKNQKIPFVIKTSSHNSAVVLTSASVAKNIIQSDLSNKDSKIIVEDYVYGTSFSFYTITDGYKALPIGSSILYKHSLEGDGGQLTSGMGACVPNYKLTLEQEYFLMDNVIYPTLDYLEIDGAPYLGILGVNGIITNDGRIQILGWNSFMQDCDSASILDILDEDLYSLFESCIIGSFSDEVEMIHCKDKYSVTLVLSCKNKENKENVINGIENLNDNTIVTFYPNTNKNRYLEYEAQNGEVIGISCSAQTASKASEYVYNEASEIEFNGMYYRKDVVKQPADFVVV